MFNYTDMNKLRQQLDLLYCKTLYIYINYSSPILCVVQELQFNFEKHFEKHCLTFVHKLWVLQVHGFFGVLFFCKPTHIYLLFSKPRHTHQILLSPRICDQIDMHFLFQLKWERGRRERQPLSTMQKHLFYNILESLQKQGSSVAKHNTVNLKGLARNQGNKYSSSDC